MHEFLSEVKPLNIFISGQKYFAERVFLSVRELGHNIVGVSCPIGDKYIGKSASLYGVPIIPSGTLNGHNFPEGVDIGIAAHSFDYVGKKTRYKAKIGWIGYHPSLLPRHRGRSSIEWAVKMRDAITGGTVFWLNSGIDRGDIAKQDFIFIDPSLFSMDSKKAASILWQHHLQDMGVRLISETLSDISNNTVIRVKQDNRFSTFEPSMDVKDVFNPDAIMLEQFATSPCDWYKK